jgi:1-acyl-sn-glycerol-3-phosphate acyltransferase
MCFSVLPIVISYSSVVITKMPDFYFQIYFIWMKEITSGELVPVNRDSVPRLRLITTTYYISQIKRYLKI